MWRTKWIMQSMMIELFSTTTAVGGVWIFAIGGV
jgi:hypothetical protein